MSAVRIALLGATGSIGRQAIEVIEASPDLTLYSFSFHSNLSAAADVLRRHRPVRVVTTDPASYSGLSAIASDLGIRAECGMDALCSLAADPESDIVLTAVVGDIGIEPTISAIRSGKTIALANKETLVAAGELIMPLAHRCGAQIIPVDSEHAAIDQCLLGRGEDEIDKILLTCSGGAFRTWSRDRIARARASDALKHPNWNMGGKITIDSATLMNKGLELIEAMHLFGVRAEDVEILIHPQSIVHSMVQYRGGTVIAQLGRPDMRDPIAYALHRRSRRYDCGERLGFVGTTLEFDKPDLARFPALGIAMHAARAGGTAPAVMNAANEVAVAAYLRGEIGFYDIPDLVQRALDAVAWEPATTMERLFARIEESRRITEEHLCRYRR